MVLWKFYSSGDTGSTAVNPTSSGLLVTTEENQSSAGSGGSGARGLIPTTTESLEPSSTIAEGTSVIYNFCNN